MIGSPSNWHLETLRAGLVALAPKCWTDYVRDDLVILHMQLNWFKIAQDRVRWREKTQTLLVHTRRWCWKVKVIWAHCYKIAPGASAHTWLVFVLQACMCTHMRSYSYCDIISAITMAHHIQYMHAILSPDSIACCSLSDKRQTACLSEGYSRKTHEGTDQFNVCTALRDVCFGFSWACTWFVVSNPLR